MFTDTDIVNDIKAYSAACDLFKARYGHNISDVIFGSKKDDWEDFDLAEDAALLNAWDCWLFVADICPNFEDYGDFIANGGYETEEADAAVLSHVNSGNVTFVSEYATAIPKEDVTRVIGSIT